MKEKVKNSILKILGRRPLLKVMTGAIACMVLVAGYIVYQQYCVIDAYAISADGEEIALVKSRAAAKNAVEDVVTDYVPEGTEVKKINTDKKLSVTKERVRTVERHVSSEEEAAEIIKYKNENDDPVFNVEVESDRTETETIEKEVKYVSDDSTFEDTTSVQTEGKDGEAEVTILTTSVNGETIEEKEVARTVTVEPVTEVVVKGTRQLPALETTRYRDYSGQVVGRDDAEGTKIAEYACKYVGMPYVWGGASLTSGADCSGFMMAVYNKFGYKMTRRGFLKSGTRVTKPMAGDIVYYPGHVAIYIGNGKVVHELNRSKGCVVSSVNLCGRHSYWRVAKSPAN